MKTIRLATRPTLVTQVLQPETELSAAVSQSRVRENRFDATDVVSIRNLRGNFLAGLGIDLLIEINPKDTRKKRQHGGEG
jgi:hypothetical protein